MTSMISSEARTSKTEKKTSRRQRGRCTTTVTKSRGKEGKNRRKD